MTVSGGFDLRIEPWIPVRLLTGEQTCVGLCELFERAHEIEDVDVPVRRRRRD
ncbi:type I-E CRISPR-associated protein Cse1/CasA [Streptomyces sp. NPDC057115]|uniref:type I-E CRISPR-associated protein Cse1/CasA n=1 Tax=unclassified Streptomyces TaxID=2593676 RepID=UPI003624B999